MVRSLFPQYRYFKNPKSSMLRFHTQTSGVTLTAQQPMNNTIRVAFQALSAVLGGTQSLHTNSYDEAIGLPTDDAVTIALRTQQIIESEIGVIDFPNIFNGSKIIDDLTNNLIRDSKIIMDDIAKLGGAMHCVKSGYQQRIIHESAWKHLKGVESGDINVIGVNKHVSEGDKTLEAQKIEIEATQNQIEKLMNFKLNRNDKIVKKALQNLRDTCNSEENIMESIIDAIRSKATLGEINGVMRDVFGTWVSPSGV